MLHHEALDIVEAVVGRDVEELLGGDAVVIHEQRGLDDGEDVQHRAGEQAGRLQQLGPLDQDAVVGEVTVVVDVPSEN